MKKIFHKWKELALIIAVILAGLVFLAPIEIGARIVASIMVFVAVLWFTEALPLWITALIVPVLLVVLARIKPVNAFAPFFDPIIALLLGGCVLGQAIQVHNFDKRIIEKLISFFGKNSKIFLLGLMIVTALISFWISNTATAALMMPIGVAVLLASRLKPGSNYGRAVVLGVAYATTIGGLGTPVGTPPNLIAIRWLAEHGIHLSFLGWTIRALPLVVIMIPLAWFVLITFYKPEIPVIKFAEKEKKPMSREQKTVFWVFAITVLLWLTETLHGIHNSVIAMLPVITLFGLNLLGKKDLFKIEWDVLLLVGGGLSLGNAIVLTGLDKILATGLAGVLGGQSAFILFFVLALFAVGFTAFVANTGAAAILIPVMIPLASILGVSPLAVGLVVGMVVSFDFIVPVGTPPNAMAYGTGYAKVIDMVKAGLLLSILGSLAIELMAFLW
ncbi:TPA: DASS family sodium-coupled anion symporter [archaeon]|uniref:DASS family sodium-coupled anion symporter n=1 Tax=Candidatus Naiadarchaeum limnaeum TaxID=2756139 RepID=A0A832V3E7_9ARCH|nr:DASS family sodium-coupled anion symporter [Candidatus Naiadarchaeum limnaeum]